MDVSHLLGSNFLTHTDLPQPQQVWTISKTDQQLVGQGQSAETKICLSFAEHQKSLVCNKTNLRRVAEMFGVEASVWAGKQLLIYRSSTTFSGQAQQCIRVCGAQQAPPDPICDVSGTAVPYQPPAVTPPQQPVAAPQQQAASDAPWS